MGFSVSTHSLSALTPVKFTYKFNKEEKLSGSLNSFDNGFAYYKQNVFDNFQDAVMSKKNYLVLTESKSLKDVFESDSRQLNIGTVSGCVFLKNKKGHYLTVLSNQIYLGGIGTKLFVNVAPISTNVVELRLSKTERIQIDADYPYTARVAGESLDEADIYRQQFEVDYKDGLISFKTKTKEGYRYLSYGVDNVVRAVGLTLNDADVNPYTFVVDFVSEDGLYYDFDATTKEIKYSNEMASSENKNNLNIKEEQTRDTNLLISCTTTSIALSGKAEINIALTKSNFSSSGTYSNKRTS